jgi:hypothetical protein
MARYFTLREAQDLLPMVSQHLELALHLRSQFSEVSSGLEAVAEKAAMTGGLMVDRKYVIAQNGKREALARRLKEVIQEIHSHGCQVKDLDSGLLDFPTLYKGVEVLLCWKRGEPSISYWHGLEEGFRGRREIDRDFIENHRGDPEN